jgi:hypothetical protein
MGQSLPARGGEATFDYLAYYDWWRVGRWLRDKQPRLNRKQIHRRYMAGNARHRPPLRLVSNLA